METLKRWITQAFASVSKQTDSRETIVVEVFHVLAWENLLAGVVLALELDLAKCRQSLGFEVAKKLGGFQRDHEGTEGKNPFR